MQAWITEERVYDMDIDIRIGAHVSNETRYNVVYDHSILFSRPRFGFSRARSSSSSELRPLIEPHPLRVMFAKYASRFFLILRDVVSCASPPRIIFRVSVPCKVCYVVTVSEIVFVVEERDYS
jgi:hypothetical protein